MASPVVVSGVGVATPLGMSAETVLARVEAGASAAGPPAGFDAGPFACPCCAEIRGWDPAEAVPEPKTARLMGRDAMLAVAAARAAMRDAGLRPEAPYPPASVALYGATGTAGLPPEDVAPLVRGSAGPDGRFDLRRFGAVALKRVRPVLSFKILSNMPISFVSIFENVQGPNAVFTPWEGQGAAALAAGLRAVATGRAPCALVGGCDVKTHALAFLNLQRQGVFRSWSERGEGPVPGEGAAFLVLEREDLARARGARVYGRLRAVRTATHPRDATLVETYVELLAPLVSPAPDALVLSAEAGDGEAEAAALARLGPAPAGDPPARVCPKPRVGNLFAAAAALQAALAAVRVRRLPPGGRVVATCFGHGREKAALLLEAV